MRARWFGVAAASLAVVLLAGCGQGRPIPSAPQGDGQPHSKSEIMASASAETTTAAPVAATQALGQPSVHNVEIETDDGSKQMATMTLYPGVSGRDTAQMSADWASVGGTGIQPCSSDDQGGYLAQNGLSQQTTYYVFGTLSFENESKGFEPKKNGWAWETGGNHLSMFGIGYTGESDCTMLYSTKSQVSPSWEGDSWGPAPIVIAVTDIYTPKYPDGDMETIDAFRFDVIPMGFGGKVTIDGEGESSAGRIPLPRPAAS